jgi:hypothetical protein
MIISDLQYIESANETEVKGGYGKKPVVKPPYNLAVATASAEAFGRNTKTYTATGTLVIQGNYSGSGSESVSESF